MQLFSFEFHSVNVSHVRRQGNKLSHILAKYALIIDDFIVWIEETPYCIEQALIQDFVIATINWIKVPSSYQKKKN